MRYFRGESDRWEPEVSAADGPITISDAFTQHMATVRDGIRTARTLALAGGALGALLIAVARPKETVFAGWLRAGRASAADAGRRAGAVGRAGFFLHVGLGSTGRFIPDGIFDAASR